MEGFIAFLIILVIIAIGVGIYFLPSIIGFVRNKDNKIAILLLNFFLGWSLVGWVVALVWAASKDSTPQQVVIQNNPQTSSETSEEEL